MSPDFTLTETANTLESKIRANRLLDLPAKWADELVYPYYGGLSLANIPHSMAGLLGVTLPGHAPLDDAVWGEQAPGDIDRVVALLIDGLGYLLLKRMLADDGELREAVSDLTDGRGPLPLTSITPSTTAVALPTLWTGRTPAAHGMVGTHMYLREFSMIGDMLEFRPSTGKHRAGVFEDWGLAPEAFLDVPGLSELLARAGVTTHVVMQHHLIKTGLSRILHRGVQNYHSLLGYSDTWARVRDVLRATAGQRCCVYFYWPAVDSLSHMYGAEHPYTLVEIKRILVRLRGALADEAARDGRTLVMVISDHGHADALQQVKVQEDPRAAPIREAMRCGMAAEMRLAHVYVRDGQRQSVIDAVEREFPDGVTWVEGEKAIRAGLFGHETPHPELPHRVGDLILIPRVDWRVVEPTIDFPAISLHGGLSDAEMLAPFLWKKI